MSFQVQIAKILFRNFLNKFRIFRHSALSVTYDSSRHGKILKTEILVPWFFLGHKMKDAFSFEFIDLQIAQNCQKGSGKRRRSLESSSDFFLDDTSREQRETPGVHSRDERSSRSTPLER